MLGQSFRTGAHSLASISLPLHINLSFDSYLSRATKSVIYISPSLSSSSLFKDLPTVQCIPSPKTFSTYLASSVLFFHLWLIILRLTQAINLFSLDLPFLRVSSGSHCTILRGSLFPGVPLTCPNHPNCLSSSRP